ncbi:P-loop containing nucleoside triphosphatehydrolases superfamily protein [Striga asiatica]|uniref:P-loop containing nucleoside triphosphatehydrolases superfamily protein n=1 Tax=Striga asiatica TaxID=4170 RepID=A0A5A7P5F4_STRAF|nr:P-loop containing nucleoside triphosphatehydrolases superfamily protein [Striga asiatica]
MQSVGEMQSMATNFFSAYASMAASIMLFRSIANDVIPEPVRSFFHTTFGPFLKRLLDRLFRFRKPKLMTLIVDEQSGILPNQIYEAAEIYLRTKINPDTDRLRVNKTAKQKTITLGIVRDQEVADRFQGFDLTWQFVLVEPDGDRRKYQTEKRYFELTFEKSNKEAVVEEYLPHVLSRAKEIREKDRAVKLYTRDCPFSDNDEDGGSGNGYWGCVNLDHPATFEKLAMDPDLKRAVIEDLDRFVRRKEYYRRVGKAWKRGYLLYGPPGTGKSSLVAAMANYLKFDVYDLELTSVYSNSDLRRTLLSTNNRSIIVIEDVDCSAQMHDRDGESDGDSDSERGNSSGMLNFIDGLWSTCGDERIIIFTTNHKEKLDPALLRPGRMDMHIHMGYCTPEGFDVLVLNYLEINDHPLFFEIKELIRENEITPAEIAEHLMRNEDPTLALEGVLNLLKQKKQVDNVKNEESDAKENKINGDYDESIEIEGKKRKGKLEKIVGNLTRRGTRVKNCELEQKIK